jgi:pyruvate/2-oxoacid:ferredoxin oxidoreductase beta subunit
MMAMTYGNVYVAQVAMGANDAQTVRAFLEAESYDGPSLIIAYSHCINARHQHVQGAGPAEAGGGDGLLASLSLPWCSTRFFEEQIRHEQEELEHHLKPRDRKLRRIPQLLSPDQRLPPGDRLNTSNTSAKPSRLSRSPSSPVSMA